MARPTTKPVRAQAALALALLAIFVAGCVGNAAPARVTTTSASTSGTRSSTTSPPPPRSATAPATATRTSTSSSPPPAPSPSTTSPTTTPSQDPPQGNEANATTHHPPVIQNFTATPDNGDAPLPVTFAINATDADPGDTLTYTLSWGDGDTSASGGLPTANLTHTYHVPGLYTAHLTVDDRFFSVETHLDVAARAPPPPPPGSPNGSGKAAAPCLGCLAEWQACAGFLANAIDTDCTWFLYLPDPARPHFVATTTGSDVGVWFLDGCNAQKNQSVGHVDAFLPIDASGQPRGAAAKTETGTIPAGTQCVLLYDNYASGAFDFHSVP